MENNQYPTILVLGASGTIGKQVVKDLEGKAVKVRITSRKQDVVEQLRSEGKDGRYLDLDDPQTFALALAGVDRVFLLTGYTVGMLTQSKTLVDAAKKAGVSHIVHVGVFAEWDTTDAHFAWHQMIEKYIEASGIAWTHLHPNMFMEAITSAYLPKNLTYTTYWEDRRVGYIASSDIAAVAAKILVDGPQRHASKDYWLSVESHNGKEIAQLMSEVTGLEIKCEEKGVEEFKQLIEAWISEGADSWYASANIEFVTQMLDGRMSYMSMVQNDIPYILGRPAKTVREYLLENKDVLVASASQKE
ncbi:NmrA family NAD(P)-binding protein [Rufibacter glacialis]|uniref:NAD(P)H-binding protein n=1 Tax=Rufibacter glacialis TaxID=1259555 RepID=A0A5M8QIG8_9BACT|nr:NmrA family NAD(P)-binding protein [Rufibacter glacialis]KAA6434750.1 NAD(P)H-binding protein [Rufibacter glacialis]GGK72123.1 nucleotide-diphosphate-sugar epimerase [Rufibacter glacialis]